jgi:outer membrane protein assembly factor BamB
MKVGHRRGILVAGFWAVNATACATPYVPPSRLGPQHQEASWPAYLGTPRHDACIAESVNADPRPLWHTTVGRAVRGSPALGETVIVVGVADRVVTLVDRATGQALWRARLAGTIHAGPLLDGDRIYVATEATPDARVYALRLRDGGTLWSTKTESIVAPLALDGDTLYAATEAGTVLRLETDGGKVTWRRRLGGGARAAPVPAADGIVVATTADTLYLLERASGQVRTRVHTPGAIIAAPAFDGARLYAATTAGRLLAIDLPALSVAWDLPAGDAVFGAPALAHDTVYALARNGTLWLVPKDRPSEARSFALGIIATAGPTPLASGVLVASVSGEVLLVDRRSGAILWRVELDGPIEQPPLVRDRQLVIVAGRGDIQAYR